MKKSIAFLPPEKRKDLNFLVQLILERLPQTEMIILYGSYARNNYVHYDERQEFGITTTYRSDYDILVVTNNISDKEAGKVLDNVEDHYYQYPEVQTPVEFINENIINLNKELHKGQYFYSEVKKEGIILYDSGKFKLARRRKLRYDEIKQHAEEYFKKKMARANRFLKGVRFYHSEGDYLEAAFLLHQACENYYYAINLVFTLKNGKQHNLSKLSSSVKKYSKELLKVFPRNTAKEEHLFKLIKSAYVEARYNDDEFKATKEDIEALIAKVQLLSDITEKICTEKIAEYESKITKPVEIDKLRKYDISSTDEISQVAEDVPPYNLQEEKEKS